jgi:hypothetical protein
LFDDVVQRAAVGQGSPILADSGQRQEPANSHMRPDVGYRTRMTQRGHPGRLRKCCVKTAHCRIEDQTRKLLTIMVASAATIDRFRDADRGLPLGESRSWSQKHCGGMDVLVRAMGPSPAWAETRTRVGLGSAAGDRRRRAHFNPRTRVGPPPASGGGAPHKSSRARGAARRFRPEVRRRDWVVTRLHHVAQGSPTSRL